MKTQTAQKFGAFQDPRVLLARPGDARLAQRWDDAGGFEQASDGPTFVVIGGRTSDAKCAHLAARFGLPLQRVLAFRAGA